MQHTNAATLATIRAIGDTFLRPLYDMPPLDSMPAGETGGGEGDQGGDTTGAAPAGGGEQGGSAGNAGTGIDPGSLFHDPTPLEVTPPENATPAPKPPAERSLEDFPAEIRDYIKSLRTEAGDNRIKAKNEGDRAAQAEAAVETRLAEQREELIGQLLKATGLMPDLANDDEPVDPAEQIEALTSQLAQRDDDHRATRAELAVWKAAWNHAADPVRLTDSRSFMDKLAKLDPGAADFNEQVAAAIGTAVESDPYYRREKPAGQKPAVPPVPSGGDFAGGPSGGKTEPQSVDDYRNLLRPKGAGGPG